MGPLQTPDEHAGAALTFDWLTDIAVVLLDALDLDDALAQGGLTEPGANHVLALFRGEFCVSAEAGIFRRTSAPGDGWCHQRAFELFRVAEQAFDGTRAVFFTEVPRAHGADAPRDWQVTCGVDGAFRSYEWSDEEF